MNLQNDGTNLCMNPEAAFERYTGIGDFLKAPQIKRIGVDDSEIFEKSSLSTALLMAVMAVGCHVLEGEVDPLTDGPAASVQLFNESRKHLERFVLGHHTVLKLQVT